MRHNTLPDLLIFLALFFACVSSTAQTFTKITTGPVVTDSARSCGAAWIDIDNDGDLDLFVANGNLGSQNNRLYINTGSGNFTSVTTGDIVTNGGSSIGSAWGDYDNDSLVDCYVTNRSFFGNFLYKGNATSNPMKQTGVGPVNDTANSNMSAWVDIDSDGDLDLYTVNFQASDFLYLNSGGGNFTANQNIPLQLDSASFSIPGLWADYNNDRRPDLFVGNSGTQNDKLYTNNGSLSFTSTTFSDGKATLGGSWADYDNDGDLDLFVANFLNQANIMYKNSGAPNYTLEPDTTVGVSVAGNNVGSAFGDLDNDGDLDLFTTDDPGNERLFINSGYPAYTFTRDTTGQITHEAGNSFACALADYDNDGHLDVFVANRIQTQMNLLYRNNGNTNRWITIKCVGMASNRSAIGTKVFAKAMIRGQAVWQMQEVLPQTGYNAQNLWLHFGFDSTSVIDTLIIHWPSGNNDTCVNIATNIMYALVEGLTCVLPVSVATVAEPGDLSFAVFPNPARDMITMEIGNPTKETVHEISIIDAAGRVVIRLPVNSAATVIKFSEPVSSLGLAPGTYFAKAHIGQRSKLVHFVIQ